MQSYLRTIDSTLGNTEKPNLNGRHGAVNEFLHRILGFAKTTEITNPCRLMTCDKEGQPMFCSDEHRDEYEKQKSPAIRIKLTGFWGDSKAIMEEFGLGCKDPNYTWENIQLVSEDPYDYLVVLTRPFHTELVYKDKTIVFQMEPLMEERKNQWGQWSKDWCAPEGFVHSFRHKSELNNLQWHLGKTYHELMQDVPVAMKEDKVSVILSEKYIDPGHCLRWNFVKHISDRGGIPLDVWGTANRFGVPNHKGALPSRQKDDGLFPYKYHIAVENHQLPNFITEKLVDGILAECLTFYWGAPNWKQYIDDRAVVWLEGSNLEQDYETIRRAIAEDWWSQRIEYIRAAKRKILNELAFVPRIHAFVNKLQGNDN